MALNTSVLRTRSLTAVVFTLIMLAGLLINAWAFVLLCFVVAVGSVYELIKLAGRIEKPYRGWIAVGGSVFIFFSMVLFVSMALNETGPVYTNNNNFYFFDPLLPCLVVFSIWINDTMAYIVGSLIGKTPLSKISPKKTIEGTVGGIILSILVIGLLFPFLPLAENHVHSRQGAGHSAAFYFIIPAICAVFGTLGDLLESKIKRMAGVKDSGSFMPGHGGFLDRFDSLLLAVVAVWLTLRIIAVVSPGIVL